MATYGTQQRSGKPSLEVLRGFDPNEPFTQTATHPVKDGVTVLSGQLIVLEAEVTSPTGYQWIVCPIDFADGAVYIAEKDSTAEDVVSAGNLPGLSCAGQFEFESAYFDGTASDYDEGEYLTPSTATAGNVMECAAARPTSDEHVIGQITRKEANTGSFNSNVAATDVIRWRTVFIPAIAPDAATQALIDA